MAGFAQTHDKCCNVTSNKKKNGKKYRGIDRLVWEDKKWVEYVENPRVKTFILKENNDLVGFYETVRDFDNNHSEIAYFGILEEYFGKKCGGYLLSEAINQLFQEGMSRVWLHTCSLDHENAIKNYDLFIEKSDKKSELIPEAEHRKIQCDVAKKLMANPKNLVVVNLGDSINTEYADFSSNISLDGRALYYTSRRPWENDESKGFRDAMLNHFPEAMSPNARGR